MNEQTEGRPRTAAVREQPQEGEGLVEVKSPRPGEALLRDEAGTVWRLLWSAGTGRTFALPSGSYGWVTYRLVEDAWHISATGTPLAKVEVRAGVKATIDAKDGIKVHLRGASTVAGVQAEVHVSGMIGGGLSIYRDGRRIPLTCIVIDESGVEVGSAGLNYG